VVALDVLVVSVMSAVVLYLCIVYEVNIQTYVAINVTGILHFTNSNLYLALNLNVYRLVLCYVHAVIMVPKLN
jgi:hypothetical protein